MRLRRRSALAALVPGGGIVDGLPRLLDLALGGSVRVNPEQHDAWMRAAKADDRSLAKWIQRCCDAAAAEAGFTLRPSKAGPAKPRPRKRRA